MEERRGRIASQADPFSAAHNAHCGAHEQFTASCEVCRRARANHAPYPLRPGSPPPKRSYGYTDKITAETFAEPKRRRIRLEQWADLDDKDYAGSPLFVQLTRLLWKLIWPF